MSEQDQHRMAARQSELDYLSLRQDLVEVEGQMRELVGPLIDTRDDLARQCDIAFDRFVAARIAQLEAEGGDQ